MTNTEFFLFAVFLFMIGTFFACIGKKLFLCSRYSKYKHKHKTKHNERKTNP